MTETQKPPFQLSFNRCLRVEVQDSRVSSDAGLLLVRQLDERLGFGDLIEQHLAGERGMNTQLPVTDLVRQSVYSRLAGTKMLTMPSGCPKNRPSSSSAGGRSGIAARL